MSPEPVRPDQIESKPPVSFCKLRHRDQLCNPLVSVESHLLKYSETLGSTLCNCVLSTEIVTSSVGVSARRLVYIVKLRCLCQLQATVGGVGVMTV